MYMLLYMIEFTSIHIGRWVDTIIERRCIYNCGYREDGYG